MNEQDTNKVIEIDDVEAHRVMIEPSRSEDVEGHRAIVLEEGNGEGNEAGNDVEAHRLLQVNPDEDDVVGHMQPRNDLDIER